MKAQGMMAAKQTRVWFALFVLLGINTLNFFDRQIPGVVGEPLRGALHLDDFELGWINTSFILLYAVVGLPLGWLADVLSRKWILAVGVTVWSILTACSSLATGFWSLFVLRLGVGVGEASCAPAANSLLGDLFPPEKRARAVAIFMLGLPLGLGLSAFVSGAVAKHWGWQTAFLAPALPGLLFGLLALAIPEPRAELKLKGITLARRPGNPILIILSMPTMWWIILSGAMHNFCMYTLGAFLSPFLQRFHGLKIEEAGNLTGCVYLFGGLGLSVAGWASDRLIKTRESGRLEVATTAVALGALSILVALLQPRGNSWAFGGWMLAGYFLLYFYYAGVYASIQDIVEPGLRGTAMGVYFCAMYLLGGAAGPVLTGWLSRTLTEHAAQTLDLPLAAASAIGLHQAMFLVPALGLPLAMVLFAASRCIHRDRMALKLWQSGSVLTSEQ